ncbi:hypothetical protein [Nocardia gipuzkoensis]
MANFGDLDPQWQGRLEHIERDLPNWIEWLAQPQPPAPGSPLYGDDKLWPKWPVSQMALQGLISATDHLSLLINSQKGPVAQFTLIRAALFAAARTVWILAPKDRPARQKHALWVAYEDFRYLLYDREQLLKSSLGKNVSSADKATMLQQAQDLVDELKQIAQSQLGLTFGGQGHQPIPSDTDIVKHAADYIDPNDTGAAAALNHAWRVNSGHAHGLGWPELLNPAQVITTSDGLKYRQVAGNDEALAQGLGGAWLMTHNAFRLYKQRTTSHSP